uniref:Putative secreted protein n=1 Tax=Ixodes ricinus TaxID=34613 RepID=A0A6B0U8Y8_IXORI
MDGERRKLWLCPFVVFVIAVVHSHYLYFFLRNCRVKWYTSKVTVHLGRTSGRRFFLLAWLRLSPKELLNFVYAACRCAKAP